MYIDFLYCLTKVFFFFYFTLTIFTTICIVFTMRGKREGGGDEDRSYSSTLIMTNFSTLFSLSPHLFGHKNDFKRILASDTSRRRQRNFFEASNYRLAGMAAGGVESIQLFSGCCHSLHRFIT